jgi:hypothetical protein
METVYGEEKPVDAPATAQCAACLKLFSCASSLKRHHERFPVCRDWKDVHVPALNVQQSIVDYVADLLARTISADGGTECRFCGTTFSNKGNFHKHFASAVACNRRAHEEFANTIHSNLTANTTGPAAGNTEGI